MAAPIKIGSEHFASGEAIELARVESFNRALIFTRLGSEFYLVTATLDDEDRSLDRVIGGFRLRGAKGLEEFAHAAHSAAAKATGAGAL
jgi:hypothetical protein